MKIDFTRKECSRDEKTQGSRIQGSLLLKTDCFSRDSITWRSRIRGPFVLNLISGARTNWNRARGESIFLG